MNAPTTFEDLILQAHQNELYANLIKQLNKDFLLANIHLEFDEEVLPTSLKLILHETVHKLIQEKFTDYLNLLYIIDVPERKVKQLETEDMVKLSEQVTYLMLLREWQKVWYRSQY